MAAGVSAPGMETSGLGREPSAREPSGVGLQADLSTTGTPTTDVGQDQKMTRKIDIEIDIMRKKQLETDSGKLFIII